MKGCLIFKAEISFMNTIFVHRLHKFGETTELIHFTMKITLFSHTSMERVDDAITE